ncbi:hypothetical protein ABZ260_34375 [Streptosporangium sp. NPDC006013]
MRGLREIAGSLPGKAVATDDEADPGRDLLRVPAPGAVRPMSMIHAI